LTTTGRVTVAATDGSALYTIHWYVSVNALPVVFAVKRDVTKFWAIPAIMQLTSVGPAGVPLLPHCATELAVTPESDNALKVMAYAPDIPGGRVTVAPARVIGRLPSWKVGAGLKKTGVVIDGFAHEARYVFEVAVTDEEIIGFFNSTS
jgi:hypothetical protein